MMSALPLITASLAWALPALAQTNPWSTYRTRFISAEGRVVDNVNASVSHSESQGYGLLLAEAHDDRETFERILAWTLKHLAVRADPLFAWRWKPDLGVDDPNNATDGDLLIAWALKRAAQRWEVPAWREQARTIAQCVRTKMLRPSAFGPLLLPGENGFERADGIVVNLSYWLFPAWRELAEIDPATEWAALEKSGLVLCDQGRFGDWRLPPDWLLVQDGKLTLPDGFPPVFGYNAIRVPLHLSWAGYATHPCVAACRRYREVAEATGALAATLDLKTGAPGPDRAQAGMRAILALPTPTQPTLEEGDSYFSASLTLLTALAFQEVKPPRTP